MHRHLLHETHVQHGQTMLMKPHDSNSIFTFIFYILAIFKCFFYIDVYSAVWLMPTDSKYGEWPRSGEIDLMESRGNVNYTDSNDLPFGIRRTTSTLHFGPSESSDMGQTSTFPKINETGYNDDFHVYEFVWNETG